MDVLDLEVTAAVDSTHVPDLTNILDLISVRTVAVSVGTVPV